LYGASAASAYLKKPSIKPIADLAYKILHNQLMNPNGGYYWSTNNDGFIGHDKNNISFAQAFVVLGLSEYYAVTNDSEVKRELYRQIDFIENKIKDFKDQSYLDGFDTEWNPLDQQYKSLATHLHMLEAYSRFIAITDNPIYIDRVEQIISILLNRFVNIEIGEVFHQFTSQWELLPNEIWIGHNLELGWILVNSAKSTMNAELIEKSKNTLLVLCDKAIEKGFDKQFGGMFNRFIQDNPITTNKEWWAQSESVLAFFTAYKISQNKKYLSYGFRLLEYIDNIFSDHTNGEWYDSVTREGKPLEDVAKIHPWKSMYHNIRYCIEAIGHLNNFFVHV
jgi:mannobiose 2-epimerase